MPRIMPDPRYISMPSVVVGAEVRMNRDLNCWPWVRSLIHSPAAVTHSPAEMLAACPTVVTSSRCPRALTRRTQNPFSALWNVTRSTRPARTSWAPASGCGFSRLFTSFQAPLLLTNPGWSRTAKRVRRLLPGLRGAEYPGKLAKVFHLAQARGHPSARLVACTRAPVGSDTVDRSRHCRSRRAPSRSHSWSTGPEIPGDAAERIPAHQRAFAAASDVNRGGQGGG